MRALILAAGVGRRLEGVDRPKCLLEFGGRTLLRRHVELLRSAGADEVVVAVGYRADAIRSEIARLPAGAPVRTVDNRDYEQGNVVTLWRLREDLVRGGDVLLMDADVLCDGRILDRLAGTAHASCFLLDRGFEPGDEPVKLCVRDGRIVEFRKHVPPDLRFDLQGESVGFFRLGPDAAAALAATADGYVADGRRDESYEEALRDLVLAADGPPFGFEDVTGLPWIEIDFPGDVARAEREILPRLEAMPGDG